MSAPIATPPAVLPGAPGAPLLVLASASRTRAALLQAAAPALEAGAALRAHRGRAEVAPAAVALQVAVSLCGQHPAGGPVGAGSGRRVWQQASKWPT
jgi:hypothetical protein